MERDVFSMIEERLQSFSKGKQSIATYILRNPNEAAFQTAALIGKAVGISESSVVRFAGDLGFKGFPDFQRALQEVAMKRLQGNLSVPQPTSRTESCEDPLLTDAVGAMLHSRKLYILSDSVGSTLFPCCKLWADRAGESFTYLIWDHLDSLFNGLSLLEPGDLIIAVVLQQTPYILTFVTEQARALGAQVLILTHRDNPRPGDLFLSIPKGKEGLVPDLVPPMTLLQDLFHCWLNRKTEAVTKQTKILEEIRKAYENTSS